MSFGRWRCLRNRFQSTLPMKGATLLFNLTVNIRVFQSTLPMKGATNQNSHSPVLSLFQSTLPMKGATKRDAPVLNARVVSIHAPNEGSDEGRRVTALAIYEFQSTLPMKGATCRVCTFPVRLTGFNPRSQ